MKKSGTTPTIRVLIIDDDEDLSSVMVDALREEGITAWSIRPVPSSPIESVVATAVWFKPHAILVDVVMPVDTGKLVKALRETSSLKDVMMLGCSGHAVLASSFAKLLDGFIHKPFSMRELADMLNESLGGADLSSPGPLGPAPVPTAVKAKTAPAKAKPASKPAAKSAKKTPAKRKAIRS